MNKWSPLILMILGIIVLGILPFGMFKFYSGDHEERIIALEENLRALAKTPRDTINSSVELLVARQDAKLEALRVEVSRQNESLKSKFYPLVLWGVPLTLLGIFGFGYGIYKHALASATAKADEEISRRYARPEELLLRSRTVRIIAESDELMLSTSSLLGRLGIHLNQGLIAQSDQQVAAHDFSNSEKNAIYLLALSADDSKLSASTVQHILSMTPVDTLVFTYGGMINLPPELQRNERIGSARFASQLFPNLVNLLSIQQFKLHQPNKVTV